MKPPRQVMLPGLAGLLFCLGTLVPILRADGPKPPALPESDPSKLSASDKPPANVAELKAQQAQVKAVLKKVLPATVGILVEIKSGPQRGMSAGTGVIINEEGYILTAGHVSGDPEKECRVILPGGKTVKGVTMGRNNNIDSGMVKITEKGKYPFVELGNSDKLKVGQWVIAVGHPGGFNPNRTPPLRLGRILSTNRNTVSTDCTLIAGDSGGPLFDLDGKLIAIHSRIARPLTQNMHVPVNTFRDTWERLVASEEWGSMYGIDFSGKRSTGYLGVEFNRDKDDLTIIVVKEGHGAEKAGIKAGDRILAADGKKVTKRREFNAILLKKKPKDEVELELERDGKTLKVKVKLGTRPVE